MCAQIKYVFQDIVQEKDKDFDKDYQTSAVNCSARADIEHDGFHVALNENEDNAENTNMHTCLNNVDMNPISLSIFCIAIVWLSFKLWISKYGLKT